MKKFLVLVAATAASAAVMVATTGSAQTTGVRTLTLFENTASESNKLLDNAPKSPATSPASRRFRLSRGDQLIARTPVFDREGGTRVGTSYVEAVVASGKKF